ncbi:unnamed protein product [Acanthosepion pharaonis]|uniref:Reverse transcriptase domain-containing protein n=1 Tax=Acanthosepion pharaonis TaxID=158019 RepID=A0A812CLL3_ACAPH|nr:unnamed protein product [Sepia pharaonis]
MATDECEQNTPINVAMQLTNIPTNFYRKYHERIYLLFFFLSHHFTATACPLRHQLIPAATSSLQLTPAASSRPAHSYSLQRLLAHSCSTLLTSRYLFQHPLMPDDLIQCPLTSSDQFQRPLMSGYRSQTNDLCRLTIHLDTGAAISVIPPTNRSTLNPTKFQVRAANGSTIETYGNEELTLNINLRRGFKWSFTVADVRTPLLSADFLAHYNLAVHMKTRTLSDNTTSIKITEITSSFNTTRISVATQHDPHYVEILRWYKDLTQSIKPTDAGDHHTQHHIKTTGQPAYSRPRRLPLHKLGYAKKAICVDYQKLNASTVPNRYHVPHIHDFASGLQGARIFSKIDLTKAYYQVPVTPEDIPKTAVTTPFGQFEFLKMPFGLRKAAQTFQRLMEEVLRGLPYVYAYIDNILVASRDADLHKQHLEEVFRHLTHYGL